MLPLLDAQRAFGAALLASGGPAGMAVYRGNVFGNWADALAGAYPVTQRIVGAEFFDAMARDFARAYPSSSGDLHEYGAQLAPFLAGYAHTQDLPYLPEVARLEWLVHRAYHAADPAPFDVAHPTEARIAPACALLAAEWPAASIWLAHQEGGDPASVHLAAGAELALVHRPDWRVEVSALRPGDYHFLERLMAGAGLGAALEAAVAADAAFAPQAALAAWVQAGVITG